MARGQNQSGTTHSGSVVLNGARERDKSKGTTSWLNRVRKTLQIISPFIWLYVGTIFMTLFYRSDYSVLLSAHALSQLLLPGILTASYPSIPLWVDYLVIGCVLALAFGPLLATFIAVIINKRSVSQPGDGLPPTSASSKETTENATGLIVVIVSVIAMMVMRPWANSQEIPHDLVLAAVASIALLTVFSGVAGWLFGVAIRVLRELGRVLSQLGTSTSAPTRSTRDIPPSSKNEPLAPTPAPGPHTFDEYRTVLEDTSRIQDQRLRATVLYTAIHMLLVIGASLFLLAAFREPTNYIIMSGFLLVTFPVSFMLMRLTRVREEGLRRVVNLRYSYLEALEHQMRQGGMLPRLSVTLPPPSEPGSTETSGIISLESQALHSMQRPPTISSVNLYLAWLYALTTALVLAYACYPLAAAMLGLSPGR